MVASGGGPSRSSSFVGSGRPIFFGLSSWMFTSTFSLFDKCSPLSPLLIGVSSHAFLFPAIIPALTSTWVCCSKVCFSAEERKSGLMNRNEPSGTHVLNAGGGGDDIDSATASFSLDVGTGISGDEGIGSLSALVIRRLTSAIINKRRLNVTHLSSIISSVVDLGEIDFAFDNLNPSSLAGKLWLFGCGRVICDRDGSENDIGRPS